MFIRQKMWSFLNRYSIFVGEEQIADIQQQFSFLRQRFTVDRLGWEVAGSFLAHDYEITCGERLVATIHKQWMTWGDCYEMGIADPKDEIVALAVVLAIDCALENANN